jgi:polyisoprenoid-binding protein YceI
LPTPVVPELSQAYPAGEPAGEPALIEPPKAYPGAEGSGDIVGDTAVYEIDPARSEARFLINEVLRGADKTVVGVSNNLGGQIAFDLNNPGSAQIGTILINARDFVTDSDFRNNAIANKILLTNEYEFVTFEPTAISGLPDSAVIGETYPLQIAGDLTITDQTREVTFDAEVTPLSENELAGLAKLEILYADFGLIIPFARAVDSVEENVKLELEFIAARQ